MLVYASRLRAARNESKNFRKTRKKFQQKQQNIIGTIRKISNVLYQLLIWSLYLQSQGIHELTKTQWKQILSCDKNLSTHTIEDILFSLKENVLQALVEIIRYYRKEIDNKKIFEEELSKHYGIDSNNCYLFVRGHDIHKYILNVFLKAIQVESKKQHIKNKNQLKIL